MMDKEELEGKVFEIFCNSEASVMYMGCPIPSTFISEALGITLYKARKALKALKDKGLIESYRRCIYSDYCAEFILESGYRLTEAGKQTKEYKEAEEEENKYWDKVLREEQ